jgi:hypothetical protein
MKIDRHNYEEYFLLYIDNELTVDQKMQVELFVNENPDLAGELVMLEQSKLVPDQAIHFDKKEMLMREENGSFVNMSNYGEWLVLYVDNELNDEERMAVEKFAAIHPHVQQEFVLFQQTTLEPEKIVFPDKEVLYRHEKVRVISMQWWRVAVAAILILGVGFTLYSILNNRNSNPTKAVAVGNSAKKNEIIGANKDQNPNEKSPNNGVTNKAGEKPSDIKDQVATVSLANSDTSEEKNTKENAQPKGNDTPQLAHNTPAPRHGIVTPVDDNQAQQPQVTNTLLAGNQIRKEIFKDTTVTKSTLNSPDVYNTPEIDRSVAGGENKKLRGFFRKTTRILVRSTAESDNKLLIGGVAINVR